MKKICTSTIGPLIMQNENHTTNETLMLDILNNFYASIFTVEDTTVNQPVPQNQNNDAFLTRVYSMKIIFYS